MLVLVSVTFNFLHVGSNPQDAIVTTTFFDYIHIGDPNLNPSNLPRASILGPGGTQGQGPFLRHDALVGRREK